MTTGERRGGSDRPPGFVAARPGGPSASRPARKRAATIEDLDDEATVVTADPSDWTGIISGVLILGAAVAVFLVPDDRFTVVAALVAAGAVALWYARPDWRSTVGVGVAVVTLALCARFGLSAFSRPHQPVDSRKADEARERRRGEAILQQRLGPSGGL